MSESLQLVPLSTANSGQTNQPNFAPTPLLGFAVVLALGVWGWRTLRQHSHAAQQNQHSEASQTEPRLTQPLQWISAGKQQERAGQFTAAIALYEAGLKLHPQDFRLWHERGLALAKAQQFEAAIESYDRAYQLRPRQRDLAHERGDALLQLGRYEEAIASFDLFLRFVPDNPHILADRGLALSKLGRYEEALHSLHRALKSVQRDPQSKRLARYYQIEALRQSGQLNAALQAAQQGLAEHPTDDFRNLYDTLRQQIADRIGAQ
jgi:tetratricopeptide (TPR) repeat protein